jgi:hypothetical protein
MQRGVPECGSEDFFREFSDTHNDSRFVTTVGNVLMWHTNQVYVFCWRHTLRPFFCILSTVSVTHNLRLQGIGFISTIRWTKAHSVVSLYITDLFSNRRVCLQRFPELMSPRTPVAGSNIPEESAAAILSIPWHARLPPTSSTVSHLRRPYYHLLGLCLILCF